MLLGCPGGAARFRKLLTVFFLHQCFGSQISKYPQLTLANSSSVQLANLPETFLEQMPVSEEYFHTNIQDSLFRSVLPGVPVFPVVQLLIPAFVFSKDHHNNTLQEETQK